MDDYGDGGDGDDDGGDYYFTNKQHQGTGLGLALCRDLVEELGGQLTLTSQPGHTCFTICLPQNSD